MDPNIHIPSPSPFPARSLLALQAPHHLPTYPCPPAPFPAPSLCRHPNILPLLCSFVDGESLYLVTPYMAVSEQYKAVNEQFQL